MFRLLWLALAGLLLASFPARAQETPAPQLVQTGLGVANFSRWQGPLTVREAVALALRHSPELNQRTHEVGIAKADTDLAEAAGLPRLGLGSFLTSGNTPMIFSTPASTAPTYLARLPGASLNLNAMLMVPLYTGGTFAHRLEAAESSEKGALARLALEFRETAFKVRQAYYDVLAAHAQADLARWELAQQSELLRITEERVKAGALARYVWLRAEAERARAQQELNRARTRVVERETALKLSLGVAVDSDFSFPAGGDLPPSEGDLAGDLEVALRDRPDLIAAREFLRSGDHKLEEALSEYAPKVYLAGMFEGMQSDPFSANRLGTGYQVGLVVSIPLYDGGEREAGEARARSSRDRLHEQVRQLELLISGQVVSTHARLASARENADLARLEVERAEEDLRVARLRYQVGRALQVEVLDAVSAVKRARANVITAERDWSVAFAELLFVTGRMDQ